MSAAQNLLGEGIDDEIAAIAALADELQANWTNAADLRMNDKGWIYDLHPYLFAPAFPAVPRAELRKLALAGRFLANAVVLMDMQIDEPVDDATAAGWALRGTALQFEGYRLLQGLFPAASDFWPSFRGAIGEFIAAYLAEQEFAVGKRSWRDFDVSTALVIATGKTAMARGSVFGLAALSGERGPVARLCDSIDEYNIARQIFDDVHDWKTDLRDGRPSSVLKELLPDELPARAERTSPQLIEDLARKLYYEDVLDAMIARVLLHVGRAAEACQPWPEMAWRKVLTMLERGARALQADTRRITAENRERVRAAPRVTLTLPAARDEWQEVALASAAFLVDQWRSGFGEARAVGYFARDGGYQSSEYQSGDVFQRALIADALLDVDPICAGQLAPIISAETDYLLSRRSVDGLGWSFYPSLAELPADADDLAQVIQTLIRSGRRSDVDTYCQAAIAAVIEGMHPDGSFETWILPTQARQTERHQRQAHFIATAWGTGADPDVVANFLYALWLYDRDRYRDVIGRGFAWLAARQEPEGSWTSTWYEGPFYGTYVNLRLAAAHDPTSPILGAGGAFLRRSQSADGGWPLTSATSDPLSTALAVSGLLLTGADPSDPQLARARDFLMRTRAPDGGWPAVRFIKMDMERASGRPPRHIYYSSRCVTTAFVSKAAAAATTPTGPIPELVAGRA